MESEKQEVETYIAEVTAAAERMQRASIDKQQDIEVCDLNVLYIF